VGKGFVRTAIGHELVGPKTKINLVNYLKNESYKSFDTMLKGNLFKITELSRGDFYGDVNEISDFCTNVGKSYLFFLTV